MLGYQLIGVVFNFGIPTTDHDHAHDPDDSLIYAVRVDNGIIEFMHIMWRPAKVFIG
jgi:hypothetical protein